jgi:hypothetical protein
MTICECVRSSPWWGVVKSLGYYRRGPVGLVPTQHFQVFKKRKPTSKSCRNGNRPLFVPAFGNFCFRKRGTGDGVHVLPATTRSDPGSLRHSFKSSKPHLCFLRCRSHPHVKTRRVFDSRELAAAGFARRNVVGIQLRYPFVPDRPPRPLMRRSAGEPFVRARR